MAVSQVLGLVWGRVPVEDEEQVWLVGDFPTCHLLGTMRQESGYGLGEACHGRVHPWGRADHPQACKAALVMY